MMVIGAFLLLVANASVCLISWSLVRLVRTGDYAVDIVLFFLIRLSIISFIVLGSAAIGVLTPLGLGLPLAGIMLALLLKRADRTIPKPQFPKHVPFVAIVGLLVLL